MGKCAMGKVCRGIVVALLSVAVVWSSGTAAAFAVPEGVSLDPDGTLRLPGAEIRMVARAPDWNTLDNSDWRDVRREEDGDAVRFRGRFTFRGEYESDAEGVECDVEETISPSGRAAFRVEARWRFARPVRSPAVYADVQLALPVESVAVDGDPVEIPDACVREQVRDKAPAGRFDARLQGGWALSLSGPLELQIQDNRRWCIDSLDVRLHASRDGNDGFSEAVVSLDFTAAGPDARAVTLAAAGAGSTPPWPGAEALAAVPPRVEAAGFPFETAAGVVAVGLGARPRVAVAEVPDAGGGEDAGGDGAVALLHAADWALVAGNLFPRGEPVGRIVAEWADGGEPDVIPVGADVDVGHWAEEEASFPNAVPAWSAAPTGGGVPATLYASSFRLPGSAPGRRVARLAFEAAHPAASWCVAAAALTPRPVSFSGFGASSRPHEDREGSRWAALAWSGPDGVAPGSALDFSFIAGSLAPAGRDGFVTATPDGFLSFENAPDKRLRLFGVNLCEEAAFLPHEIADNLVETLRRTGYNAVRIHHHDGRLVRKDAATSLELDPERLDRLDYLVAACKRGGLYVSTDLHVGRPFRPGDGIDCENPATLANAKGLFPISEKARENLKAFARAWLGHVNPYTGLALKDDPVLASLTLVNEELIELTWGRSAELVPRYRARFAEWKALRGVPPEDETSFPDFLRNLEDAMMDDLLAFVRGELGVRCPVNTTSASAGHFQRGDFSEVHTYFAHPVFPGRPWAMPVRTSLRSPVRDGGSSMDVVCPRRQSGRPVLVTELYYCHPAPHRMQGVALTGAFAGRQGWDGLFVYTWSSSAERIFGWRGPPVFFEGIADPMQQLGARIVAALFARGDMAPARIRLSLPVPPGEKPPRTLGEASLRAAVGCHPAGSALPAGVREWTPQDGLPPPDPAMRLDRENGTFAAVSPCAEALALERGDLSGDALAVSGANRECVVAAVSRDGAPLPRSADVLVVHVTNMSATGLRWEDGSTVSSWGGFPLLVERGAARVSLAADGPRRVEALDADGNPAGIVPATFENGRVSFLADVSAFPCGVVAYRLRR